MSSGRRLKEERDQTGMAAIKTLNIFLIRGENVIDLTIGARAAVWALYGKTCFFTGKKFAECSHVNIFVTTRYYFLKPSIIGETFSKYWQRIST